MAPRYPVAPVGLDEQDDRAALYLLHGPTNRCRIALGALYAHMLRVPRQSSHGYVEFLMGLIANLQYRPDIFGEPYATLLEEANCEASYLPSTLVCLICTTVIVRAHMQISGGAQTSEM